MDIMVYKNFEGTAELDMQDRICRGRVLFINDLITYEADTIDELEAEFHAAVDDYLETCRTLDRKPHKPLKGVFNVRISPALHKAAVLRAARENIKLNELVGKAIDAYVNGSPHVTTNTYYTIHGSKPSGLKPFTAGMQDSVWTTGSTHGH
ncbi:MAG: hypothetical protein H6Q00_1639 [Holophagaceae bacterium]|nr:hypothetical protein [Holophagaceae bacterium]